MNRKRHTIPAIKYLNSFPMSSTDRIPPRRTVNMPNSELPNQFRAKYGRS